MTDFHLVKGLVDEIPIMFLWLLHKSSPGRGEFDLVSLILIPSSSADCSCLKLSHQGFEIIVTGIDVEGSEYDSDLKSLSQISL